VHEIEWQSREANFPEEQIRRKNAASLPPMPSAHNSAQRKSRDYDSFRGECSGFQDEYLSQDEIASFGQAL